MRKVIISSLVALGALTSVSASANPVKTFNCYGETFMMWPSVGHWQKYKAGRTAAIIVKDDSKGPYAITDTGNKPAWTGQYIDRGIIGTMNPATGEAWETRSARMIKDGTIDEYFFTRNYESQNTFKFMRVLTLPNNTSVQMYGTCQR